MDKSNTFHELVISNTSYNDLHTIKFPFTATKILIVNDSLEEFEYSFNGRDKDGKILWDDESHEFVDIIIGRIWFKTITPGSKLRVFAWAQF